MPVNRAAENLCGTIGTVCWSIQLIPQIWKSFKDKSTKGLSELLLLMWATSGLLYGVYAIVHNINVPIIVQPQIFCTLALLSCAQCQYYDRKRPLYNCAMVLVVLLAFFAGLEAGLVCLVRPMHQRGNDTPAFIIGTLGTVFNFIGFLPQYYEIWKHKEVCGISLLFLAVDISGGAFSTLSLVFKAKFDLIAGVCYAIVIVGDGLIILASCILNPRAKRRRQAFLSAAVSSKAATSDELLHDYQSPVIIIQKAGGLPHVLIVQKSGILASKHRLSGSDSFLHI